MEILSLLYLTTTEELRTKPLSKDLRISTPVSIKSQKDASLLKTVGRKALVQKDVRWARLPI
jgi:hypothetical protein